jgi:hypothetical protein
LPTPAPVKAEAAAAAAKRAEEAKAKRDQKAIEKWIKTDVGPSGLEEAEPALYAARIKELEDGADPDGPEENEALGPEGTADAGLCRAARRGKARREARHRGEAVAPALVASSPKEKGYRQRSKTLPVKKVPAAVAKAPTTKEEWLLKEPSYIEVNAPEEYKRREKELEEGDDPSGIEENEEEWEGGEADAGLCRAVRRVCVLFDVSHAFAVECPCSAAGTFGLSFRFAEKRVSART